MQLLLLWLVVVGAAHATEDLYELNIIHFNDFHAHFEEVSPSGTVCIPEEAPCIGGYARLYTAIKQVREAAPESILLNGGDTFQGTIWYNLLRWNASYYFMNLLPHDAHVLGNHEFDHGVDGLVPYLERLNAPMLGANVNTTLEPELDKYVKNHVIIEKKGRKIGIIGVLLRTFSAPIGRVVMEDELEAINREAAILTDMGVDIIIVLSHVGYNTDLNLAESVSRDVDIIVGAHSHTLLYTGATPNNDTALGDYPTVRKRDDGHTVLIVQASCYTRYLGNIKLYIDDKGIIQSWKGEPIFLGSSIVPDPDMVAKMAPWQEEVSEFGDSVLGSSKVALNRGWCYRRECNMGSWACDGFLQHLMHEANGSAWHVAHVCLMNAGGMRVQIDPGNVTTRILLMSFPFENDLQVYDLKGQYLLQALEFSVGVNQNTPNDFYSARLLQIGGMRVVYNASQPIGSRVVSVRVRCIDCDVPVYEPLNVDATYRVVSQNYIGDGGGGYTMLSQNRENLRILGVDYEILQEYVNHQQVIMKDLDGRIQIVW